MGKTKELVSIANMLAKGFAASTVFHALKLEESSIDKELSHFADQLSRHVLTLEKNSAITENDFYIANIQGSIEIVDLITGKKIPKAFTKSNLGLFEGYRVKVNSDSEVSLAFADGSLLKIKSDSSVTF